MLMRLAAILILTLSAPIAFAQQPPAPYPPQPYPPQPYPPQPYPQPYPQPTDPGLLPPPAPKKLLTENVIEEPIWGLVAGGAILFVLSYGIPLIGAASSDFANAGEWTAVPVFGTFITLGERESTEDDTAIGVGLVLTGLYQMAGVAMFTSGLAVRRTRVERTYAVQPTYALPWVTRDSAGVMAGGQF